MDVNPLSAVLEYFCEKGDEQYLLLLSAYGLNIHCIVETMYQVDVPGIALKDVGYHKIYCGGEANLLHSVLCYVQYPSWNIYSFVASTTVTQMIKNVHSKLRYEIVIFIQQRLCLALIPSHLTRWEKILDICLVLLEEFSQR